MLLLLNPTKSRQEFLVIIRYRKYTGGARDPLNRFDLIHQVLFAHPISFRYKSES